MRNNKIEFILEEIRREQNNDDKIYCYVQVRTNPTIQKEIKNIRYDGDTDRIVFEI